MSMRYLLLWIALPLLSACGDLTVQSIRPEQPIPEQLVGLWLGSWNSIDTGDSGTLSVSVQQFGGEPVVALDIDNPCLVPREYELLIQGASISLRADGVEVLSADLVDERELEGTYGCPEDNGTWRATWFQEIPEPIDLSGVWDGSVYLPGVFEEPLSLTLVQSVRGGALVIDGMAEVPGLLPESLPLEGVVTFGNQGFQLALEAISAGDPEVSLFGFGNRESLTVQGAMQITSSTPLPFNQAAFEVSRQ